jgi:hypothetical protein
MPLTCGQPETRERNDVTVSALGSSDADATHFAWELALAAVDEQFIKWLRTPCPKSCSGKLVRSGGNLVKSRSQPTQTLDTPVGTRWRGFASYSYSGTVYCFDQPTADAIQLAFHLPGPVHVLKPKATSADCGINRRTLTPFQVTGPVRKNVAAARAAATKDGRRFGAEQLHAALAVAWCDSDCPNRVEFTEIRTQWVADATDAATGDVTSVVSVSGEGHLYCLGEATWLHLITTLVERGLLTEPGPLLGE